MKPILPSPGADIYSKPSGGYLFSPFSFHIDKMERLILVNFEKDPDEIYNTFELQEARDMNGRESHLVVAYRNDGSADIYHQESFPLCSQAGILNDVSFFVRPLENAKFEVNAGHPQVFFAFDDKNGRQIKVTVNESGSMKKNPFFLLAPVGVVSKQPVCLPVYSLYEMSFIRRRSADIEIEIDKVKRKPDTFPLPIDYSKNYFTRYSADTFNVDWNRNFQGRLMPLIPGKDNKAEDNGTTYELLNNDGHFEIVSMNAQSGKHRIDIGFSPPVPDIECLAKGAEITGSFMIRTDRSAGTIRGEYLLERPGDEVKIRLQPNRGWQTNERRWILKLMFRAVRVFTEWPKSYIWNAGISFNTPGHPTMKSGWSRI